MKIIFFVLVSLIFSIGGASAYIPDESEKIYWDKDYPLEWEHFEGNVGVYPDFVDESDKGNFGAFTTTWLESEYYWEITQDQPCMYKITYAESWASFLKSHSWVTLESIKDMELLNHEQRHFDIYKIGELKLNEIFKKEFLNKEFPCPPVMNSLDDAINQKVENDGNVFFNKIFDEINQMQTDYDSQTDHYFDKEEQKIWNEKIDCLLENNGDETKCTLKQITSVTRTAISEIPSWIKNNAGWWADGAIDDTAFLQGISYLIKEEIIVIPPTEISSSSESDEVPTWIKNNAAWWAEGAIDDGTFVTGIQFLVKNGIIAVENQLPITRSSEPLNEKEIQERASEIINAIYADFNQDKYEKIEPTDIMYYEPIQGELVFYDLPSVSKKLEEFQNDISKHQEIWNNVKMIYPEEYLDEIVFLKIATDGVGGEESASIGMDVEYTSKQALSIDIMDAYPEGSLDDKLLKGVLIHELAHTISYTPSQSDDHLELAFTDLEGDEFTKAFLEKEQNCKPTFFNDIVGCMKPESYLNVFFQKFWVDIYSDYTWPHEIQNAEKLQILQDVFYTKYEDQFVSDYAATFPSEDFADTFTEFVLKEKPLGNTVTDQKILFFYDYPEFVKTRDFIRNNL